MAQRPEVRLWFQWTLATTIAIAISTAAGAVGLLIGPVAVAIAQWLVLRSRLPRAAWWLLATTVSGWVWMASNFFLIFAPPVLTATIGGLVIGACQWLYLRHHSTRARWWIFGSAIGLTIGAGGLIYWVVWFFSTADASLLRWQWAALGALSGIVGGSIKGATLVWILRSPRHPELR